ncbi:MAG: MarR family transcriptional regulator [Mameliella sp.]|nr:MarR family transcriptional regulator [Phaeodactylibacter sp.]
MNNEKHFSGIEQTVFYALEKAIKTYRQFAQRNIRGSQLNITIDQWLVLRTIKDHPDLTQSQMAAIVFKDYASVTRIIELMVDKGYLMRSFHKTDRRRYQLKLTDEGMEIHDKLVPIVQYNRETALDGLRLEEISQLQLLLQKITANCTK